jgi:death-on-curing protein
VTRYISLAEYFWLAEQVTGLEAAVLIKAARADLADSALPLQSMHVAMPDMIHLR